MPWSGSTKGLLAVANRSSFGTRLYVHQVMSTLRAGRGDIDEAAAYLGIVPRLVRAAVEYYAEFADEVDEDAAVAETTEGDERARWERQRRALA